MVAFMELERLGIQPVNDGSVDVHQTTSWQQSAIHRASSGSAISLIKLLIEKRVEINVRDDVNQTGWYYVVQGGRLETVAFWLEKGLDVNDSG